MAKRTRLTGEEELEFTTITTPEGRVIKPNEVELDPDWVAEFENPPVRLDDGSVILFEEDVGVATGENYVPEDPDYTPPPAPTVL